jgi:hypothetical protein
LDWILCSVKNSLKLQLQQDENKFRRRDAVESIYIHL